jgi:hypothetical protein
VDSFPPHLHQQNCLCETRVVDPRLKLLGSTCQIWSLVPIHQIKRHGEGQRKEFVIWQGTMGRGRVSTLLILSHLLHTLKGTGQKVCINCRSHRCVLVVRGSSRQAVKKLIVSRLVGWGLVDQCLSSGSAGPNSRSLIFSRFGAREEQSGSHELITLAPGAALSL